MFWKKTPVVKIYEALGCIADKRIEIGAGQRDAKVFSSSRGKFYTVIFDPEHSAIMANDNGSYWQGYVGYPAIAFLMVIGEIKFNLSSAEALKNIAWKDINVGFKNDFEKTKKYVLELAAQRGHNLCGLEQDIDSIAQQLRELQLKILGEKIKPPEGY